MAYTKKSSSNANQPTALTREDQAKIEIGQTEFDPMVKWTLVLCFLITIVAVPLVQTGRDWTTYGVSQSDGSWLQAVEIFEDISSVSDTWRQAEGGFKQRIMRTNAVLLRSINEYEDELEQSSFLREFVLPPAQLLLARVGAGNEKVYIGKNGWLYYRPAIDLVTGPGFLDEKVLARRASGGNEWQSAPAPDPRPAILDFHSQLEARGIQLVLMPTPVKSMVHPENFRRSKGIGEKPALNASHESFLREMKKAGVLVFDPTELLVRAKFEAEEGSLPLPQFLATDTHWRPESMDLVAAELSQFLKRHFDSLQTSVAYPRAPVEVSGTGDIAGMLQLPADQRLFLPEEVTVQQVRAPGGELWSPDQEAEVLLLGDSFSNIFSLEGMGWGESAGLAEQVSFHLNSPLDTILRNDAGAYATRQILATELARGRDRLAGKRVVIWQFAARELAVGDWKLIQLPELPAELRETSQSDSDGDWFATVSGGVVQASDVPGTGVPYRDHIRALHLRGLESLAGTNSESEAVVYVWDMRDRELTPEARLGPGDRVTVRVREWDEVSDSLGRINRSELEDPDLLFLPTWWGERVQD